MRLSLYNGDQQLKDDQSFALLGRFKLNFEKAKNERHSSENYFDEQKILSLLSRSFDAQTVLTPGLRAFEMIGARLIQVANLIGGLTPATVSGRDAIDDLTDIAYFYERRRAYHVAAQIYEIILETMPPSNRQYPFIFLHLGFCEGLMGNPAAAIASLKRVENLPETPVSVSNTAFKLRKYIEEQIKRRETLQQAQISFRSALELYYNMQYFDAIEALNTLIRSDAAQELYFYRGRAFEEIGQADKAIADYRRTIYKYPLNQLTRLANRRLFMLGAFYENNPTLREEAAQRARLLGDGDFIQKSELYEKAANTKATPGGLDSPHIIRILGLVEKRSRISLTPGMLRRDLDDWSTQHARRGTQILQDIDPELKANGKLLPELPSAPTQGPVKILTKDGRAFLGYIKQETESHILLFTEIGRVTLQKKDIAIRQLTGK
ncbi:MAG: tetratricopeptide repeat protein [Spirochaetota bacterium]